MNESCGCSVKKFPEPKECPECHQWRPVDFYRLIYCPLHQAAPALREACQVAYECFMGKRLDGDDVMGQLRKAIATAEGRG